MTVGNRSWEEWAETITERRLVGGEAPVSGTRAGPFEQDTDEVVRNVLCLLAGIATQVEANHREMAARLEQLELKLHAQAIEFGAALETAEAEGSTWIGPDEAEINRRLGEIGGPMAGVDAELAADDRRLAL